MQPCARELTAPHYSTLPRDRERRLVAGTRLLGGTLEVREELAQGGTAVVYRAIDHRRDGAEVALKVVTAEADRPETRGRFENEARLGASLTGHPNVVEPLQVGSLDAPQGFEGRMFLMTELVEGVSLDILMGQNPTGLPVERACSIARDIADALVELHERGIVHRDIKPGNVLVADADGRAKLADFGLAYATGDGWEDKSPDLTEDGHIPGTPLYMAPEALAHERPAPSFDVFSFGVALYELLAGEPPYAKLAMGALIAHKCDPERVPYSLASMCPELPSRVTELVHRCMAHEAARRPSARQVLAAMERILDDRPELAGSRSTIGGRTFLSLAAIGAASVAAMLYWGTQHWTGDDVPAKSGVPELTTASYAKVAASPTEAPVSAGPGRRHVSAREAVVAATVDGTPSAMSQNAGLERPRPEPTEVLSPSPRPREPSPTVDRAAKSTAPPCDEARQEAHQAAHGERWRQVLRLTRDKRCWGEGHAPARQKLRTWAYLETERFAECIAAGKGASDRLVVRWTKICNTRVDAR